MKLERDLTHEQTRNCWDTTGLHQQRLVYDTERQRKHQIDQPQDLSMQA